ncbi:MAG TPA: DUF4375 domain-containing protein [Pirellulales bacterium]
MNADHEDLNELLRDVLAHGRTHGLAALNPSQRIAFLILELDAYAREEQLQGFYAGPYGGRADVLVESLEAIGALQSGALMRRANALFPGGRPSSDLRERQAALQAFDEPSQRSLHEIGREFLTDYDTLSQRLHAFAREKREALVAGL